MRKKSYKLLPLIIVFILTIAINIFYNRPTMVTDETVTKIIDDSIFKYVKNKDLLKDPYNYNNFYLLFDERKLNTRNFISLLSDFKREGGSIKKVYPYINPKYDDYLKTELGAINFLNRDLESGINNVVEQFLLVLNDYGLDDEIDKVNIYGIDIRVVLVNASNRSIYNFLTKYKNVKVSDTLDGNYKLLR
ncbi:MAG: hypothetical protein PHS45_00140 [Bacilli bacterium]|nr:hypothetical protein [Bacilli bacterium]